MISFIFSFLIPPVFALTVVVDHPEKGVIVDEQITLSEASNVGRVTMDVLTDNAIAFDGSELGFSSIDGLEQRLDILSKSEMKAYGWCFSVNGQIVETLAHQTPLEDSSQLRWFYAFAHYQAGVWVSQCEENPLN